MTQSISVPTPIALDAIKETLAKGPFIGFSVDLAREVGGIHEAILLRLFYRWSQQAADNDGWFQKTRVDITEATTMTRAQQDVARASLVARGLVEEQRRGLPALLWRRVTLSGSVVTSRQFVRRKAEIPAEIRWAVWERDNFTCLHCGSRQHLAVDHIYPESKGGTLDLTNLQTLCRECNSRKGAR